MCVICYSKVTNLTFMYIYTVHNSMCREILVELVGHTVILLCNQKLLEYILY